MAPLQYTRVVLAERPKAAVTPSTFRKEVVPFDSKAGPSQVLVKVEYVSLDPAMRGWLNDRRSYIEPVKIGAVMRAAGLGVVVEAGEESGFAREDLVSGTFGTHHNDISVSCSPDSNHGTGWTEYALMEKKAVTKLKRVIS